MSEADREIIDQLASTGTYVTRDGDGVLRHWNGITLGFVSTEGPGGNRDPFAQTSESNTQGQVRQP